MDKEKSITNSWQANASNWIAVIQNEGIESRKLATNKAIVDAICKYNPASALDIGCGEGWLSKILKDKGIEITGVDVIPELIVQAKQQTTGEFLVASYEDIILGKIKFTKLFDAIVINFALIAKESTENLLAVLPGNLAPNGTLFIQTLHPLSRKSINDYITGWKKGSWDGLGDQFTMPYEWYFRTMEDWIELIKHSGFENPEVIDILHPITGIPLSVIFIAKVK